MNYYQNMYQPQGCFQPAGAYIPQPIPAKVPPLQGIPQQVPVMTPPTQTVAQPLPGIIPPTQGVAQHIPGMLPLEESYIENILRLNKGKIATIYMSYDKSTQWNSKVFKGVIEAAGRDHIILSDPNTGTRYLLLMIYLDYITFEGEINYLSPQELGLYQAQTAAAPVQPTTPTPQQP